MKKFLLLLLIVPVVFFSCSSDDDDNYTNTDIVGTWQMQPYIAKEVQTNNAKATKAITEDLQTLDVSRVSFVFKDNGEYTWTDKLDTESGTFNLKGNRLTLTDSNGEKDSYNISLFSDTFSYDEDFTDDYKDGIKDLLPDEKNVVVSKVIVTIKYKRK